MNISEVMPNGNVRVIIPIQLRKTGLFDRLEEMGIKDGDVVSIYDFEFEYQR